jgi:hypothetical protein
MGFNSVSVVPDNISNAVFFLSQVTFRLCSQENVALCARSAVKTGIATSRISADATQVTESWETLRSVYPYVLTCASTGLAPVLISVPANPDIRRT